MDCPACKTERLSMTERQGIEIDYCPKCRGVWLDRGELDKLVERGTAELSASAAVPPQPPAAAQPGVGPVGYDYGGQRHGHDDHRYSGRQRKSFLRELFD